MGDDVGSFGRFIAILSFIVNVFADISTLPELSILIISPSFIFISTFFYLYSLYFLKLLMSDLPLLIFNSNSCFVFVK